ncbi:ABC transporter ATP-binding protein [Fervidibacillus halotolerans]|uniref:ABC transporter ATP-binding protein n=1 Tax=Fervidibacillus halotolerans TaxID=2980027 RepID=A0A9E8M288_9BACI|nr:ABC transporter ATP-binding protein [Fervidibacillus halotolerans]WAA12984.1 ABC transporter ATP-binding protein [Fervidibacillus halotolerans]
MNSLLAIEEISKTFKKKTALYPISLQAKEGECIVLTGGNGAGKSTLLHIIAGISVPSTGTVKINSIDFLKDRKKYVSKIGYMPDEFYAQQSLTVKEFLQFYGSFRNVSNERIDEVIELIGLEEKRNEEVKHLSKGMRQRLLFGQAICANPSVLIMDEPTNGLDPYWINQFVDLIKQMKKKGTTVIFSTHMMDVAAEVGDQILFMENGKLVKTLQNDFSDPASFTFELLHLYRKV